LAAAAAVGNIAQATITSARENSFIDPPVVAPSD
jgi:hypothetical protein